MVVHHMEESPHCRYITEVLQMEISVMSCYEQVSLNKKGENKL